MFGKNKSQSKKESYQERKKESYLRRLAILEVEPINFMIRNEQEKESINNRFKKFLNALDFPIQIVIGTNYLNLDSYINKLELRVEELIDKTKKKIFNEHFESYKKHLINTIKDNSVLDRTFLIVIPEKTEIGLEIQLGVIEQQLKSLNLIFKKLNEEEIKFLLNKKYVLSSHVPLGGGRQQVYLLKTSTRESNTHFFLVKAIEEYLLQYTDKVKCFETAKPDVVFQIRKKKIAIEVESGVTLEKRKDLLRKKVGILNENFSEWFFVVTDSTYAYKYVKFGKTFTRKNVCKRLRSYFGSKKSDSGMKNRPKISQRNSLKKAKKGRKRLVSKKSQS